MSKRNFGPNDFIYAVGGVSVQDSPILSGIWSSHDHHSKEKIQKFLVEETKEDFEYEHEDNQVEVIFKFVPKNYERPVYPRHKDKSQILLERIEKEIPVKVDRYLANNWHEDLNGFISDCFLYGVHTIFLLRVTEDGKLEWRTCDLALQWKFFGSIDD